MGLTRGRLWERDGKDPQCQVSGVLCSAQWVGKTLLLGFNTYLEERDSLSEAKIFAAQLPLARSPGQFHLHAQTRPVAELAWCSGGKGETGDSAGLGGGRLKTSEKQGRQKECCVASGKCLHLSEPQMPHLENGYGNKSS